MDTKILSTNRTREFDDNRLAAYCTLANVARNIKSRIKSLFENEIQIQINFDHADPHVYINEMRRTYKYFPLAPHELCKIYSGFGSGMVNYTIFNLDIRDIVRDELERYGALYNVFTLNELIIEPYPGVEELLSPTKRHLRSV